MKKIIIILIFLVLLLIIMFGVGLYRFNTDNDIQAMTLGMKTWEWENSTYNNDTEIKPLVEKKFTLSFKDDKTFSATTDCNNMGGKYTINENQISFTKIFATEMYCENSQEADFTKMLSETQSYFFTPEGKLIFEFKFDSGSFIFK